MGSGGGSPWGAAITSISAGLQAIVGNKAYQNSLDAQKRGAAQGAATREKQYGETKSYLMPYFNKGQTGLNLAENMLKPGYKFNAMDPSYAWRLQEGQKALERSASARGNLLGGQQLKALTNYGQGAASQEYGNQFNRAMGLAGLGYNAASGLAGYSNAYGNAQAAGQEGIANAEAANIMSKYQNWQNLDSQAAGAWSGFFNGPLSSGQKSGSAQNTAGNYGSSIAADYNRNSGQSWASPSNQGQYSDDWRNYVSNSNQMQNWGQSQQGQAQGGTNNSMFGGSWQNWAR